MSDVVPDPETLPRAVARGRWGSPAGYGVSLGLTALVTLLGWAIFARGNITNVGLLFLLPVMVAATRYGLRTAVVTGLASSLAYNFFFIPPTHTFTIDDPQNIITVLVLLGVAVVSSQLAAQVRAQALLAQASSDYNSALASFARQLTGIGTRDDLLRVACAEIARMFAVNTVALVPEGDRMAVQSMTPASIHLDPLDHAAARWVFDNNRPAGRGSDTLTASEWLFHPLGTGSGTRIGALAVFGVSRSDADVAVRPDQRPLLLSLLDQAGLALERIALVEEMSALAHVRERDRLRQALLSSVSHDLRTPLTTILGSLREIRPASPEQEALLAATRIEAERLHRFVANLLDMVRIEAGSLAQSVEPVDLSDAVASALDDLGPALRDHRVEVEIGTDLPLVTVDPQLFHHCLINLIENAAKHGDASGTVTIRAGREGAALALAVEDEGPGIPEAQAQAVFETFTRLEGSDRKGGSGLGLAIVKGFAEAMGLEVRATNRTDRAGAAFVIRFDADHLRELPV